MAIIGDFMLLLLRVSKACTVNTLLYVHYISCNNVIILTDNCGESHERVNEYSPSFWTRTKFFLTVVSLQMAIGSFGNIYTSQIEQELFKASCSICGYFAHIDKKLISRVP